MSIQESFASVLARPPPEVMERVTGRTATIGAQSMPDDEHKARFARLVREHHTFVWRSARRLGVPPSDIDDVVQDVFLLAARKLDVMVTERGYLFQTCAYVAGHIRRSARRRREVTDDDHVSSMADERATPERNAENAEAREQLQTILEAMPDDVRSSFVLFELEGFKMTEIAEITNAPIGTVGSRIRRGREIFLSSVEAFGRGGR
jgi:RNA polymerase sigma-70 factor (ECF subfamily)